MPTFKLRWEEHIKKNTRKAEDDDKEEEELDNVQPGSGAAVQEHVSLTPVLGMNITIHDQNPSWIKPLSVLKNNKINKADIKHVFFLQENTFSDGTTTSRVPTTFGSPFNLEANTVYVISHVLCYNESMSTTKHV